MNGGLGGSVLGEGDEFARLRVGRHPALSIPLAANAVAAAIKKFCECNLGLIGSDGCARSVVMLIRFDVIIYAEYSRSSVAETNERSCVI